MNTIWFTVAIQALKLLRWYFERMSPEEQRKFNDVMEAWRDQIRKMPLPEPPPLEGP